MSLAALAVAVALPVHAPGCSSTANYAMVRSLASGRADIDRYHWQTCDKSYIGGHLYANKAPGLPAALAPVWKALRGLGADDPVPRQSDPGALYDVPRFAIWPLMLVGAGLPALTLFLLLVRVAERVEPGLGLPAAACVALGTLVLPFSSLLFSHVLAALLGTAAFALLFRPDAPLSTATIATAGLLAGLSVVTEYPLGLVAAGLGLYVLRRGELARRALAFGGGFVLGLLPLLAYNKWAFGSFRTLSYTNAVIHQGQTGHDVFGSQAAGFYGITAPRGEVAVELLASQRGLLVVTPIVAAGLAGLVPLARRGFAREAVLVGGLFGAYLVYLAGYAFPFGVDGPGPRLFMPVLPLLVLPLAVALRRRPVGTGTLALLSTLTMATAVATGPLLGNSDTDAWARRLLRAQFVELVPERLGAPPEAAVLLFFAAVLAVAVCGAVNLARLPRTRRDTRLAVVAALGWVVVAGVTSRLVVPERDDGVLAVAIALGAPLLAAALAVAVDLRTGRASPARV